MLENLKTYLVWLWNIILDTIARIWAWLIYRQIKIIYLLSANRTAGSSANEILANWGIYKGQAQMSGKSWLASGIDSFTTFVGYKIEKLKRKK